MERKTYLDGLRGLACIQVVLCHYWQYFPEQNLGFLSNGACAVALFFLMSGLVLTGSFGRAPEQILTHAGRRGARLWIPALCSILIGATLLNFGYRRDPNPLSGFFPISAGCRLFLAMRIIRRWLSGGCPAKRIL
jgi:peptidoglycan/LPS O-acetylase OafA/YrhL